MDSQVGITERFHNTQTLQGISLTLLRSLGGCSIPQGEAQAIQIDAGQQVMHGFGTHLRNKFIGILVREVLVILR